MSDFEVNSVKSKHRKRFCLGLLVGVGLIVIWSVLLMFMTYGWLTAVVNIAFLIATAIVIGIPSIKFFRLYMPNIIAIILSSVIWVVMVVLIRSLF